MTIDLARARILITNDDGVHASGLKALERIARSLSNDVWVVAPATEQSASSHSLTIARPLRVRRNAERWYAVDGTPTDSVMMAAGHLMRELKPELVLSGVNRGANLADDITYSGTVSGALEGALLGAPGIAVSMTVLGLNLLGDGLRDVLDPRMKVASG